MQLRGLLYQMAELLPPAPPPPPHLHTRTPARPSCPCVAALLNLPPRGSIAPPLRLALPRAMNRCAHLKQIRTNARQRHVAPHIHDARAPRDVQVASHEHRTPAWCARACMRAWRKGHQCCIHVVFRLGSSPWLISERLPCRACGV